MSCSIGEFHKVNHQPMLKKYPYHMMLLYLLYKHKWKFKKGEAFLAENNNVMT